LSVEVFEFQNLRVGVKGLGLRGFNLWFGVQGVGWRVQGSGFNRVWFVSLNSRLESNKEETKVDPCGVAGNGAGDRRGGGAPERVTRGEPHLWGMGVRLLGL